MFECVIIVVEVSGEDTDIFTIGRTDMLSIQTDSTDSKVSQQLLSLSCRLSCRLAATQRC